MGVPVSVPIGSPGSYPYKDILTKYKDGEVSEKQLRRFFKDIIRTGRIANYSLAYKAQALAYILSGQIK